MHNFKRSRCTHAAEYASTPNVVEISFHSLLVRLKEHYDKKLFDYYKKFNLAKYVASILKKSTENVWKSVLDFHLLVSMINIFDISQRYAIDISKAMKIRNSEDTQQEIEAKRGTITDLYYREIEIILNDFAEQHISIEQLQRKIIELFKSTGILDYYSNTFDDEEPNVIQEILSVIKAYRKLINFEKRNLDKSGFKIKLKLEDASIFLKEYAILRNHTDFPNVVTLCKPDYIKYFKNKDEFYFSSGQDSIIRLFTYINLAVGNLQKSTNNNKISLIILLDEPDNTLHPEMQKQFINLLNNFLNSQSYRNCKFHVIMTTHSPVITSDLTSNHIIFLNNEGSENNKRIRSLIGKNKPKTFAQNIYNLYKESFFIKDGLIGDFADHILSKIYKQISDYSNSEQKISENEHKLPSDVIKFLINEIGETLIKQKFTDKYEIENRKTLLKNVIENNEIKEEVKEQLITLILKNGGNRK